MGSELMETAAPNTSRWRWFCGYCAAPSSNGDDPGTTRVCRTCGLGLMLEAPEKTAPLKGDAFVVIDGELLVRAVSMGAERLLEVSEPDLVGQPLDELLPMSVQRGRLQRSLELAAGGDETPRRASVLLGRGMGSCRAHITCCGPVSGALIVLERPAKRSSRKTAS